MVRFSDTKHPLSLFAMMNDQTNIVGSPVIVDQPTPHQAPGALTTQSIRVTRAKSAQATAKEAEDEDAALIREEEVRMLADEEDEEITSEEEEEDDESHLAVAAVTEKIERKLMTVALMESVVDSASSPSRRAAMVDRSINQPKKKNPQQGDPKSNDPPRRYGLRKRRRPSVGDVEDPEESHCPSSSLTSLVSDSGRARPLSGQSRTFEVVLPPITQASSSMVPNPLASAPIHPPPILPTTTISAASKATTANHAINHIATVPCPLSTLPGPDAPVATFPMVSNAYPEPEQALSEQLHEKRKVTISEDPVRTRGLSIDLDSMGLGFTEDDDEGNANAGEISLSISSGGRGRAFSFECFAFGISADEPLPPLGVSSAEGPTALGVPESQADYSTVDSYHHELPKPQPEYSTMDSYHRELPPEEERSGCRPRGESIIFDPTSFQDGGIHEQSALETARAPSSDIPGLGPSTTRASGTMEADNVTSSSMVPSLPPSLAPTSVATTSAAFSAAHPAPVHLEYSVPQSTLPAVTSYTATTTIKSATTTTTVTVAASATAVASSMAMELLNKDGRIGIYLPEARKARIARFHAKRARRIWRKRIKYDCRKKLADSRPRIKGRFVKRSDMEED